MSNNNLCQLCNVNQRICSERYPNSLCRECTKLPAYDIEGNLVTFSNIDVWGGFVSYHEINGEIVEKNNHVCFINGQKIYVDEARFGGIVFEYAA